MGIEDAIWIMEKNGFESPVFRRTFWASELQQAVIDICGLGWFELYLNGNRVGDELFTPAVSNYESLHGKRLLYPLQDQFSHPRVYYCRYVLEPALFRTGENLLSVQLGNGWYNQYRRDIEGDFGLGAPRLAFSLRMIGQDGAEREITSDTDTLAGESEIRENNLFFGEVHDLSYGRAFHQPEYAAEEFSPAVHCAAPEGELTLYEYPHERVIRVITPLLVGEYNGKKVYDAKENISGRICFDVTSGYRGMVCAEFSEKIHEDGSLDVSSAGGAEQVQRFCVQCSGLPYQNIHPRFSWQAFQYFTVEGEAENIRCEVIHTDIAQTGFFSCSNPVINRLLEVYIRTQLDNLHGCVPSDCPHRERLGYTGDGQITCETVMHVFDARAVYKKWMRDITDCQNIQNGHIQHTAPFFGGGGGPGGWGGAVIVIAYTYYQMYGSDDLVRAHLDGMKRYLEYMESRCERGLVVREEVDGWCLGDWCFTGCTAANAGDLPPAFVNTIYLIKCYDMMLCLEDSLHLGLPQSEYQQYRQIHVRAVVQKYYSADTGDFCRNAFAANAFAIDVGLGDDRTRRRVIEKYRNMNGFDTGIFGTEILLRVLGNCGEAELVYQLLTSVEPEHSFGYMLNSGATTLWEDWDGKNSHNHPMFGGCLKALWTTFLGIQSLAPGFRRVRIQPCDIAEIGDMNGSLLTPQGTLSVRLERMKQCVTITVDLPEKTEAALIFRGKRTALAPGRNVVNVSAMQKGV